MHRNIYRIQISDLSFEQKGLKNKISAIKAAGPLLLGWTGKIRNFTREEPIRV